MPPRLPHKLPPFFHSHPSTKSISTYGTFLLHLLSHIEICIHQILYTRSVYPRETFTETRSEGGVCVMQNCCEVVNKFIRDVVECLGSQLSETMVRSFSLNICDLATGHALERWVFTFGNFPQDPKVHSLLVHDHTHDSSFEHSGPEDEGSRSGSSEADELLPGTTIADLEAQFRAVLTQIIAVSAKMEPLGTGNSEEDRGKLTWWGMAELGEGVDGPVGDEREKAKWVMGARSGRKRKLDGVKVTPLRCVEAGAMSLELWAEESAAKGKLRARRE